MTINRVRHLIERVIANLRIWRVLHSDYRRLCSIFGPQNKPSLNSSSTTPHE